MAIVSISRIQVRRGRENQDGVPQLAGGELAWAVDTQKLYIGNGAVSEGAPAVGNTELLSTKTNLFDLADQYVYNKDSSVVVTGDPAISRTLQERLDENVSVRSFGAQGDGSEQADKIQYAIDQLFANTDKTVASSRVTLKIPAGIYRLNKSIKLPPHTNIVGDGSAKTIFTQTANEPIFETVNDTRTTTDAGDQSQTTTLNQAREIKVEGMSLETTGDNIGILLRDCANSEFKDVQIKSNWVSGDPETSNSIGIKVKTLSTIQTIAQTNNNLFDRVRIEGFSFAIVSEYTDLMVDNVFTNGIIQMCRSGIILGKDTTNVNSGNNLQGPVGNKFSNTKFIDIDQHTFIVHNGTQNISTNNRFFDVGNDGNGDGAPVTPIIDFKSIGNKSDADFFARTYAQAVNTAYGQTDYIPEITGRHTGELAENLQVSLQSNATPQQWLKLPADISKHIEIDYVYKGDLANERTGKLTINVDKENDTVTLDDEFRYTGSFAGNQPDPIFTAQLGLTGNNTLILNHANPQINENGTINISIRATH